MPWAVAWGHAALLVQGQQDLIASGLNFSDCHGQGGTVGRIMEYPTLKYLFMFIAVSKDLYLFEALF